MTSLAEGAGAWDFSKNQCDGEYCLGVEDLPMQILHWIQLVKWIFHVIWQKDTSCITTLWPHLYCIYTCKIIWFCLVPVWTNCLFVVFRSKDGRYAFTVQYFFNWSWHYKCYQPVALPSKHNVNPTPVGRRKERVSSQSGSITTSHSSLILQHISRPKTRQALHAELCCVDCLAVFS